MTSPLSGNSDLSISKTYQSPVCDKAESDKSFLKKFSSRKALKTISKYLNQSKLEHPSLEGKMIERLDDIKKEAPSKWWLGRIISRLLNRVILKTWQTNAELATSLYSRLYPRFQQHVAIRSLEELRTRKVSQEKTESVSHVTQLCVETLQPQASHAINQMTQIFQRLSTQGKTPHETTAKTSENSLQHSIIGISSSDPISSQSPQATVEPSPLSLAETPPSHVITPKPVLTSQPPEAAIVPPSPSVIETPPSPVIASKLINQSPEATVEPPPLAPLEKSPTAIAPETLTNQPSRTSSTQTSTVSSNASSTPPKSAGAVCLESFSKHAPGNVPGLWDALAGDLPMEEWSQLSTTHSAGVTTTVYQAKLSQPTQYQVVYQQNLLPVKIVFADTLKITFKEYAKPKKTVIEFEGISVGPTSTTQKKNTKKKDPKKGESNRMALQSIESGLDSSQNPYLTVIRGASKDEGRLSRFALKTAIRTAFSLPPELEAFIDTKETKLDLAKILFIMNVLEDKVPISPR